MYPRLDTGLAPPSSDYHGILSSQRVKCPQGHTACWVTWLLPCPPGAWGLEVVGWGECWCWGALDPLNLGEGRSACLSSLGVYPELRAVAWVAPLTGLWRRPGRKEVQSWHCPTLLGQDWGLWGRSFPGTRGAQAEDGAEAGFHSCGRGRRVIMCPSLALLTVVYGRGGVGKGRGWHLDSLSFSFQGVAPQQIHPLRQLCP